ncbi:efflux RND transporter permease subunit [Phaeovibrio sulfidiphilus]|uniref:Efflux RND transporter permease subunit n=1 Tax=Phaeovibrio sulfidiphilus TaxID=1220600 RepID=A0A8J6YVQ9_9PROT|nr:efflux RND transporter permease subunit [Phaeovibrio sulfidiphilus]MBE1236612.1 efflux RND transporter permease subunit [Phaeovibrio sulfidiphilus]
MGFSSFFIRRPVFAAVLCLLLVILGIASAFRLPIRELPDVDSAVVTVSTFYTGAAPNVVDTDITEIVESAVAGVSGVKTITSRSRRGRAYTSVEFDPGINIDEAVNDVRDAVARIRNDLPEDVEEPRIAKSDTDSDPVMRLVLRSSVLTPMQLTDYAERYLIDRLTTVDGVAQVDIYGERRQAIRIWLDRRALAARNITIPDVEAALLRNNMELPAGDVESESRLLQVRTDTLLKSPDEFGRIVLKVVDGYPVRLRDVAQVVLGPENDDMTLRSEGIDAIGIGIIRQSQSNTVAISRGVRAEVEALQSSLPAGTSLQVSFDEATFINRSIHEVAITLVIAVVMVILVNLVFLGSLRATLIPSVTIPVALIGSFIGILALGFSINTLTLLALILAIGIVVDDAIVVLENIQRRINLGEAPLAAAALGTRQVMFAVIATTLALVSVFIPISFMGGTVGKLFTEFGFVMASSIAISSVVALVLCPPLSARFLSSRKSESPLSGRVERGFEVIMNGYRRALDGALRAPVPVLGAALVFGASAIWLYPALPGELTPPEDRGMLFVQVTAPQGMNVAYTDRQMREVEAIVQPLLDSGEAARTMAAAGAWNRPNRGFVVVPLVDWSERGRTSMEMATALRGPLDALPGVRAMALTPAGLGLRGSRTPLQVVIGGPDFDVIEGWANALLKKAEENRDLINPELDYESTQPEILVEIDRERAADLGVGIREISQALQTMMASRKVTRFLDRGREYEVILQAQDEDRLTPQDMSNVFVRTTSGLLVPLDSLIRLKETSTAPDLNRYNRMRSITLSAGLAQGYDIGSAITFIRTAAAETLPAEATVSFTGQSREYLETSGEVVFTFVLALVVVYLVLAAQFESFLHPLVILMSVPLAVTGSLLTLWLTGNSINVYSQIGIILLIGLMAKNGILIVEFANQLRDAGQSVRDAILNAATLRLRPIVMTVLCSVLGAVPLVLSSGAGSESREAVGAVIIGGQSIAALMTLFVTPVLYYVLAPWTRPAGTIGRELGRLLREERKKAREAGLSLEER